MNPPGADARRTLPFQPELCLPSSGEGREGGKRGVTFDLSPLISVPLEQKEDEAPLNSGVMNGSKVGRREEECECVMSTSPSMCCFPFLFFTLLRFFF